ncbi:hypothetical protein DPMN_017581 [Dreissena polymorpha]|uniref:Uncharacterized protein n=1 Tax=Dreissena polymorpha TaxID=45954 RepID=A0A9D4NGZ4_DREPO|nr:hypothetical protein DPMN_017581 [Dreissena polymorpha]
MNVSIVLSQLEGHSTRLNECEHSVVSAGGQLVGLMNVSIVLSQLEGHSSRLNECEHSVVPAGRTLY